MAIYKDLLSEKHFLQVAARSRALDRGTHLISIKFAEAELVFKTDSASRSGVVHTQRIILSDITVDELLKIKSFGDMEKLIKSSKLKVWCSCEAFTYWGYKYIAWKKHYGIEKELRRPRVRNKYQQGYVCSVGETKVLTSSGLKRIDTVKIGDFVYGEDGLLHQVTQIVRRKSHVLKVSYGDYSVRVTPEHRFRETKQPNTDNSPRWCETRNLIPNISFLKTSLITLPQTLSIGEQSAFLLGLYLSSNTSECVISKTSTFFDKIKNQLSEFNIQYKVDTDENIVLKFPKYIINYKKSGILSLLSCEKIQFLCGLFYLDGIITETDIVWKTSDKDLSDLIYLLLSEHTNPLLKFNNCYEIVIKNINSDYIKVTSIEPAGIDMVYSLTTGGSYLFEGGVISHNCKHLYLVMQVFPFISKTIAKKYMDYLKKLEKKQAENKLIDTKPQTSSARNQDSMIEDIEKEIDL